MKTDFYTKAVLTVIAVALVALAIENTSVIPKANAETMDKRMAMVPVNPDGTIDVNIQQCNTQLPVNIKQVDDLTADYPLQVVVQQQ